MRPEKVDFFLIFFCDSRSLSHESCHAMAQRSLPETIGAFRANAWTPLDHARDLKRIRPQTHFDATRGPGALYVHLDARKSGGLLAHVASRNLYENNRRAPPLRRRWMSIHSSKNIFFRYGIVMGYKPHAVNSLFKSSDALPDFKNVYKLTHRHSGTFLLRVTAASISCVKKQPQAHVIQTHKS